MNPAWIVLSFILCISLLSAAALWLRGLQSRDSSPVSKSIERTIPDNDFRLTWSPKPVLHPNDIERTMLSASQNKFKTEWLSKGRHYHLAGAFADAVDCYNHAIAIDPEDMDALKGRADCYYVLGQFNKSISDYDILIKSHPESSRLYFSRADCYSAIKAFPESVADLKSYFRLPHAEDPAAYFLLGFSYQHLKNYEEALKNYSKAIELGRRDYKIFYNRAEVYLKLGQSKKALADADKSVELAELKQAVLLHSGETYTIR